MQKNSPFFIVKINLLFTYEKLILTTNKLCIQ